MRLAVRSHAVRLLPAFLISTLLFPGAVLRLSRSTVAFAQTPPRTDSPPITAAAGQVIRGVRITSTSGPCITINNVADVWVDNVELGPCAGNGVRITGAGAKNIRVTNSVIHTERRPATKDSPEMNTGVGVFGFGGPSDVLIQGNEFLYNESSVYVEIAENIRVIGNYSLNPLGPMARGQHFQFNKVLGGEITDNYGESRTTNVQYLPKQEDAINLFQSSRVLVLRNYMVGGDSPTGCGVLTEKGNAGLNGDANVIADNVLIRTAQCGIGMAGGTNIVITRNKVLDTNIPNGSGNIGVYVSNRSGTPRGTTSCSVTEVTHNIISNRLPDGKYNNYFDSSVYPCPVGSFANNITGDAARLLLTPETAKLPRPPIPPRPYVPGQGPYGGAPRAIPGRIQAEDYDMGGEGVGYHDLDATNLGGAYRSEGVDIAATPDAGGGHNVGWFLEGEWLAYTVNVAQTGTYDIQARVGSALPGRTFHIEFGGVNTTGPVAVPLLATWDQFQTVTIPGVALSAGVQVMRLVMGPLDHMNLNWVSITPVSPLLAISSVTVASITTSSAAITWITNVASDSQVDYGLTTSYGSATPLDTSLATAHAVTLSGLAPGSTYHYRVTSRDAAGTSGTSADFTFATLPPPLAISSVTAASITASSAAIAWITNLASDSQVEYGLTPSYGSVTPLDTTMLTAHMVTLGGLAAGSNYHYRVTSRAGGNLATSGDVTFTTTAAAAQAPFKGAPWALPGLVQAEDFDAGGEGLAYHDLDAANLGGVYRSEGVDIAASPEAGGGYVVGWFKAGEWLTYTITVAAAGTYDIQVRVGSALPGRTLHIEFDGVNKTGPVAVPLMTTWEQYQTVTIPGVALRAGVQVMRLVMGPLDHMNLNWVRLVTPGQAP